MNQQPSTPNQRAADEPVSPLSIVTSTGAIARVPGRGGAAPSSPVRFAATTNAFGLSASPLSSAAASTSAAGAGAASSSSSSPLLSASRQPYAASAIATSPTSAGTVSTRRLRRPSMLSLAQTPAEVREAGARADDEPCPAFGPDGGLPSDEHGRARRAAPAGMGSAADLRPPEPPNPFQAPSPRWGPLPPQIRRVSSAPPLPLDGLTTSTPPLGAEPPRLGDEPGDADMGEGGQAPRSPPKWLPAHLQPRAPGAGRLIPGALLATLISEEAPLEHEMRSEARLQRLLASHPSALPFTPRQRRSTRGRFPEMFEDDDDDGVGGGRAPRRFGMQRWRAPSSDESDDDDDDWGMGGAGAGAVNSEFASAMDMDRPVSSSSSGAWTPAHAGGFGGGAPGAPRSDSGKSTPGQARSGSGSGSVGDAAAAGVGAGEGALAGGGGATPAVVPTPPSSNAPWPRSARMSLGMAPSPGMQLPMAFGGLGMGGGGLGTPLGSPTVEKLELATSPGMSLSPGMMQYREARPGKRKAAEERFDPRFDPYKRPRGSSPSPFPAQSPSRPTVPVPSSPSHPALGSSAGSTPAAYPGLAYRQSKAYARPARSRAVSPALSIGSTSGVLSSALASASGAGRPLAGPFIPTGPGASAAVSAAGAAGAAPHGLGGLGLLSLARQEGAHGAHDAHGPRDVHDGHRRASDAESIEMIKEDSHESVGSLGTAGRMDED